MGIKYEKIESDHYAVRSPRYRSFVVTLADATIVRYSGVDVTLEEILRRRGERLQEVWTEARKAGSSMSHAHVFSRTRGDEVLWEGDEVLAVLRTHVADTPGVRLTVYRMDSHGCLLNPGRIWDGDDDEKAAKRAMGYDVPDDAADDADED
jgi:hypothetical protein